MTTGDTLEQATPGDRQTAMLFQQRIAELTQNLEISRNFHR
ncbi:MAG: hypothetical protein QNJ53_08610 [Pleurocapsa sp. MO_192.B19]|nr:hypothetical protein [Pleurocapsa sp. MO_192.B19]